MHLVKAMENSANVKAKKPYIRQEFYPMSIDRYITFQPYSKHESKNYPFWEDVLKIIGSELNQHNIAVVQLGGKNEKIFESVYNCVGSTNINQAAFIIQNGLAHIGADSCMCHIAGSLGKPVVAVYGNNYIENVKPYWNKNFYGFDGYGDFKPCFSEDDPYHLIYNIKPEDIAEKICKVLNLNFNFPFKTLWTGDRCIAKRFDVVPNQVLRPETFKTGGYVIRMDYEHNEENMFKQLQQCPCTILANKPIENDLIPYKKQIVEFAFEIKSKEDAEFVNYLHQCGINYYLFTYLNEDELNKIKIHFLDFHPIIIHNITDSSFLDNEVLNDLFFESKRIILSNQKIYLTKSAMDMNKPVKTIHEIQQLNSKLLNDDFYKDIDFIRFFKLTK